MISGVFPSDWRGVEFCKCGFTFCNLADRRLAMMGFLICVRGSKGENTE